MVCSRLALERAVGSVRARLLSRPALGTAVFSVLYLAALMVTRHTELHGTAVIWPAAPLTVLWVAHVWPHRRRRRVDLAVIAALATAENLVSGALLPLALVLGSANAVQAVVTCALVRSLQRRYGTLGWQLRRSSDLAALVLGSVGGAAVPGLLGGTASHLTTGSPWLLDVGGTTLRVATSTFVVTAVFLRLLDDRPRTRAAVSVWRRREAVVVALGFAVAYLSVFGGTSRLPLAFLLVPLSLVVALRFSTTVAAVHVVVVGAVVVAATRAELGPFAIGSPDESTLLAQAFMTVIGLVTLVLALNRDERVSLVHEARQLADAAAEQHARADEQARLLSSVLETMREGVALIAADGHFVVRNAAVGALMGGTSTPGGSVASPEHYGLRTPDGAPVPRHRMADVRALAGEVIDEDVVMHDAGGSVRTLAVHGTPVTTPDGETQALLVFSDVSAERSAAREVTEARDRLAGVLDAATEVLVVSTDTAGHLTVFNVGAERMLGWSAAEVLGRDVDVLHEPGDVQRRADELGIDPDGPQRGEIFIGAALRDGHDTRQWTLRRRDGRNVCVVLTTTPMRGADGTVTGFIGIGRDVTAELEARTRQAESEERFRLAFDTAPVGMMLIGLTSGEPGTVLQVNAAMPRLLGFSELELLGSSLVDLVHPDDADATASALALLDAGTDDDSERVQLLTRYLHSDGSTVWTNFAISVVRPDGWESYAICLVEDVTARRQAEEALTHQALHDALTGLPNRSLLTDRLQHAIRASERAGTRVGVLFCDLDGFKTVNDTAGHAAGDELLQHVAARLLGCIRPGDTVARLGGDEFAVICPGLKADADSARAEVEIVGRRVIESLAPPILLSSGSFTVGASIGVSTATAATSPAEVLKEADEAMYAAKLAGKGRVSATGTDTAEPGGHVRRLVRQLRTALDDDELVMHGQPVLDIATGRVVAVETLIRWQHPQRGLLSPAHFLDVVENSPLMLPVGRRVLEESCRMAAGWFRDLGEAAPAVHVNVSGRQLEDGSLHDDVTAALQRHGLPASRLVIELTETHMPTITDGVRDDLQRLRTLGVRIALDDVGTGYSSMTRLTEMPVDVLKIDLAFVAGLGVDPACDAVVRAVLSLGQGLGTTVVAEGVETSEQADLLRDYGCLTAQGYLYSAPRSETDLLRQLLAAPRAPIGPHQSSQAS